ncbi:MAG: regulatory iron-sulfur-containing complex subunit RicT [Planctomycetota bacterium]
MVETNISLEELFAQPPEKPQHGGCGSCGSGSAADGLSRCGNGLEKIYPTTAVRFGYLRYIGEFTHAPDMRFTCGAQVVIQTKRGIEIGAQVSLTCGGCDKSVTRDQMKNWVESCGEDSYMFDAGRILREATAADLAEYAHIQASNRERRRVCRELATRHNLPIRVVECESPFGGERILFYFTAETRVDFREMVKDLTREYRTRIEMRQIGARDEARLMADFETCGREVCCKTFLKTLRPITMRMAKLQKATLDPTQVSGRCGRLKCCLRYEHVAYEELDRQLPRVGVRIRTNHGDGVVVNRQVLTQLVQIRTDSNTIVTVVAEDITAVGVEAPPRAPVAEETSGAVEVKRRPQRPRPALPERPRPDRPATQQPLRSAARPVSPDQPAAESVPDSDGNVRPAEREDPRQARPKRGGRRRRGRRRSGPNSAPGEGRVDGPTPDGPVA